MDKPIGHTSKVAKRDGYAGKIKYWTGKYNEAYKTNDFRSMRHAMTRLVWFNDARCQLIEKGEI
jgi:hypothetical protein